MAVNVQREHEAVVARSLPPLATIEFLDARDVDHFLAMRRTAIGFLVSLARSQRADVERTIRRVRLARPAAPIIACATTDEDCSTLVVCAVRAGADHLALRGFDDLRPLLRTVLGDPAIMSAGAETLDLVLPWIPVEAHRIVGYGIANASRPLTVADLCEGIGTSERSLHRLLHALSLPTPASTISWCRLFLATYLLAGGRMSMEHAAGTLGFGSGSGLRRMLRRYGGWSPTDARDTDALGRLARLYRAGGQRRGEAT